MSHAIINMNGHDEALPTEVATSCPRWQSKHYKEIVSILTVVGYVHQGGWYHSSM